MSKKKLYITPKGRAEWAKIFTPDTKFNADGEFSVTMVFPQDEAQELMEFLDAELEASVNKALKEKKTTRAKLRTQDPYEIDEETGEVRVKFKLKRKVTPKNGKPFTQKPAVFDARRNPIAKEIQLWNGSVLRIGYETQDYFTSLVGAGVSLRLKQVQVIEAVAGSGVQAAFDEDEDGYEYDESDAVESTEDDNEFDNEDGYADEEEDDIDF